MENLFSIEGKVIIVTGAGRGIGYELATNLAKYSAIIYSLDKKFAKKFIKTLGTGTNHQILMNTLKKNKYSNFELIKGDVVKTLPLYLKKNKGFKIALLHLDLDIFRPTTYVLKKLFSKMSRKGVILIDDYGEIHGATKAIDDFFSKKNCKIEKLNYYKRPSYIVV